MLTQKGASTLETNGQLQDVPGPLLSAGLTQIDLSAMSASDQSEISKMMTPSALVVLPAGEP